MCTKKRNKMNPNRLAVSVFVFLICLAPVLASGSIVISQVLYNPVGEETREWIELYNPAATPKDISGWNIYSYFDSIPETTIPLQTIMQPRSFYLIGDESWEISWAERDHQESIWLSNNNAGVKLTDQNNLTIDAVGWGVTSSITNNYVEGNAHPIVAEGNSLKRIILSNCIPQDTNDNSFDFIEKSSPFPRNSKVKCEPSVCGDKKITGEEVCDGNNKTKTCQNFGYSNPNTSLCSSDCLSYDLSQCVNVCGDGILEPGEDCDDNNTIDGDGCSIGCKLEDAVCGDDIIGPEEECDNSNLNGHSCQDFGYSNKSTLTCSGNCLSFDLSQCNNVCGDNNKEPGESCDDGNTIDDDGCSSLCQIENVVCGDSIIGFGEECDSQNLDQKTCIDFGYSNPNILTCSGNCLSFDLSQCNNVCGDNNKEPGEECDDGNLIDLDGCSAVCALEIPKCGDNKINGNDICDGSDLAGKTCLDYGYSIPNTLACQINCQ
ncbi:MAG: DUF4215 domain-containing protein, partial [Candidatus Aenigmatarchaeota archaeon]